MRSTSSNISRRQLLSGTAAILLSPLANRAHAKVDPLRIGLVAAFTGPAQALGKGMRIGIEAAFTEQNRRGGVHGRMLELISHDDAYEPARTAPLMRQLIDEEQVFAVLGNVGTPTAAVAVPIAQEKGVPLWGAFTGAALLRKTPPDRYVINYRASYAQEMAQLINRLLDQTDIQPDELAFFTQNDAYGDSGYAGAIEALHARGYKEAERLVHARYPRNTTHVEYAVSQLIDPRARPRVVFMVGTAGPCAKMITLSEEHGLQPLYIAVSFVGATPLLNQLGKNRAEGIVVSQVVPHPEQSDLPAAMRFRDAVPDPRKRNFVSFEGYLAARMFIESASKAKLDDGPDGLIASVESGTPIDLGLELPRALSRSNHQFEQSVWPTMIEDGEINPLPDMAAALRE